MHVLILPLGLIGVMLFFGVICWGLGKALNCGDPEDDTTGIDEV
jgi:hypothetical protein